ncbi:hypothetical protein CVT25_012949 [Psilocybe cyanescens]|uniref:Integrase catalytic domain-containing protein n=1 Tax=Psilocybe cyanescens TaxID=93625 RepID=A0A409XHK0_PSICY|nr:hypothetical protein CVT25_012949 [Psilocybe cyanescens]
MSIAPISAFPAYPVSDLIPHLWHRPLGHPGQDTTCTILTKNLVDGIQWIGELTQDYCVSCIIGKAPQTPFISNKKQATNICELIHMDTCGPFPIVTPTKEKYFLAILDDTSNVGAVGLMILKNDTLAIWWKTTSCWENVSGNQVKAVHVDRAKEFVAGKMCKHFDEAESECGHLSSSRNRSPVSPSPPANKMDYNPNKPPESYNKVMARLDKAIWIAAMQCKKDSLEHRGTFECVTPILANQKTISV